MKSCVTPTARFRNHLSMAACSATLLILSQAVLAGGANVSAKAYVLIDPDAKQVLAQKDGNRRFEPASTTKLMTALLVFKALRAQHIDLQQKVFISGCAWKQSGTTMYLHAGMEVTLDDLIKGLLVQSGNDAAYVLAEVVGGTVDQFVIMMNAEAQRLGMLDTHFMNPAGLPEEGHLSSAVDLGALALTLVNGFPEYAHYFAIKEYHYPGTPTANRKNRNPLLFSDPSVTGMKTGYTAAAGYCLVATAQRRVDATHERGMLLVLLGAENEKRRAEEAAGLIRWGYRAFEQVQAEQAVTSFDPIKVWKGMTSHVEMGLQAPVTLSVPTGQQAGLRSEVEYFEPIIAPVEQGQQVGVVRWSLLGGLIRAEPIIAQHAVPEGGWLSRTWGSLCLWLRGLLE
ncbi:D-alanyl-D-alanine carboxypeptidase [Pseudomonas sp. S44]|uniref:D-alanyl-D-alanine carboxypeptidase family protein n=1 Tax=Pseudomonas sp. S44 TaxID=2767450 RepID=UPI00190A0451|nr:D-alanyl-D-alanine carboxypeptidase family protein [Pseudomonas sp. S44]MBK0057481.1 D-alanyl-D-alanine carboxypeptidase [Pseudomonas sp. S44]